MDERVRPMPRALPEGTVTFLLTDVEGSTRLWESQPGAMQDMMAAHDALIAEHVDRRAGVLLFGQAVNRSARLRAAGYARMLRSRDAPGDTERAALLAGDALQTARRLGMCALERRVASL